MKAKMIIRRSLSLIITVMMLLSCISMPATAETSDSRAEAYKTVEQTIDALLYTDGTYSELLANDSAVTITGALPDGATAKAYPVTVDAENVRAAYDITLFDASGAEFEPESAVTVDISTPEIETAIENGADLTAYHIADDEITEEISLTAQSGDTVTFEAESFSIYYIAGGTNTTDENVRYRRTYVFYNLKSDSAAGSTDPADYEPYYFTIERGGRTMQTNKQTITEGESLLVPQLPYHGDDAFAGWYIGTANNISFDNGNKVQFNAEITGVQSKGADETVYLYACYGVEKYLTFYYDASAADPEDDMVYYVYPVVIPTSGSVTIDLFNYQNQNTEVTNGHEDLTYVKAPVPTTKNVFLGWSNDRMQSQASAGTDATTQTARESKQTTVTVNAASASDSLSFYPLFDEANWINFDSGANSNGADYQAPIYIITTETKSELPYVTRKGYTFSGWYYDPDFDRAHVNSKADYTTVGTNAKRITDAQPADTTSTSTVPICSDAQTVNGVYTISGTSTAKAICPNTEITLHALWTPAATTYKIAFWAQSDTVHYDTVAGSDWSTNDTQHYDYLCAVDSSEFSESVTTGTNVSIEIIRSKYSNYLSNADSGYSTSEYVDTSKFFYNDEKTSDWASSHTVDANGNTVINVYFDRVWYKFSYFKNPNSNSTTTNSYSSASNNSDFTYYNFPGGYLQNDDGSFKYYANIMYNRSDENGPYQNYSGGTKYYYTYNLNKGSFSRASYTPTKYSATNLESDKTLTEIYGADLTGKWPTDNNGAIAYKEKETSESSNNTTIRSAVHTMPANNFTYQYHIDTTRYSDKSKYYHIASYNFQDLNQTWTYPAEERERYYVYYANQWAYPGKNLFPRSGYTPYAIVGSSNRTTTKNSVYFKDSSDTKNIPLPNSYTINAENDSVSPYEGTTKINGTSQKAYYWDFYYIRNSYKLTIADADNISHTYVDTTLLYEEDLKPNMMDYDEFKTNSATEERYTYIFNGGAVPGYEIGRPDDTRIYRFAGVYRDATATELVYGTDQGLVTDISENSLTKMPDHDVTLFIKWELVRPRVYIDPNEGALTSSTESTYFKLNALGEKIQEYKKIERKYIPDENGDHYYMYVPYSAVAQPQEGTTPAKDGANGDTERYAKYIKTTDYGTSTYNIKYSATINSNKETVYTDIGKYTESDNPKVYKENGSVKTYSMDPFYEEGSSADHATYQLVGWFKVNDDDSLSLYNFNEEVYNDTSLRAIWNSGQKYRIVYDANEYENGDVKYYGKVENAETKYDTNQGSTTILNYGEGASAVVKYAAKADESSARAQFLYWEDKKGRRLDYNDVFTISNDMISDEIVENGEPIKIIKLTAHYSDMTSIGLQYNSNTGDSSQTSAVEYYSKNSSVNLHSATRDGFTNNDKTLVGWSSQSRDNSVEFALGGTYGISEENADENGIITLYAVWKTAVTVTYKLNGGSFPVTPDGLTGSDQTYTATSYVGGTAPNPSPDPTKSSYTFKYWTTEPNPAAGTSPEQYDFDTQLTEDITLYAYYTQDSSSGSRTINVRYFYVESNGSLTEKIPSSNSDFWSTNRLPKTSLTVSSTATNISSSIKNDSTGNSRNFLYDLRRSYNSNSYKVAIGIGSADTSKTEVRAVGMLNNGNAFNNSTSITGTYIKYATGNNDILWSAAQNGNYELFEDNPAVYVIIFPSSSAYTYNNITVTTTVTGDPTYTPNFKYRVDTTALDSYPAGTQEFTLKPDETRTVSLLSTSTANQTATITQTVTPNNFTLTDITGGDSHDVQSKEAVAAANTNNSIVTFKNNYTKPSDDPITSSDENLTISGHKFTDLPESDRPAGVPLLNGDNLEGNELTVNIAVVDTNDVIVDNLNVTGSVNSAKFYTEDLEDYKNGDYRIKVMLTVKNDNDPTVSLGNTFTKTGAANNAYSAISTSGTSQYVDGTNTINWTKIDNNTYEVSVDDLFGTNGKLKGAAADGSAKIDLYSQIRTERIHVIYKYYDRDRKASQSALPDINPVETTISNRYSTIGSADLYMSNIDRIGEAISKAQPSVDNELDTVIFFASQTAYVNALTTQDSRSLRGTAYYSDYYTTAGGTFHTDCYGRTANVSEYMQEYKEKKKVETVTNEKWVTYKSTTEDDVDITAEGFDIYEITEVTVWGFNTPTPHIVSYVIPDEGTFETESNFTTYNYLTSTEAAKTADNQTSTTVYFAKPENTVPEFATYYFNQRLGEKVGSNDNDLRNKTPHHLEMYGQSYKKSAVELPKTEGVVENGTIALPTVEGYTFDGWYMEYSNGKYAKICSDERFGDRVTTGVTLYAGYTKNTEDVSDKPNVTGITLTKNGVEQYVSDTGVERIRYITMLNAYGYGSNGESYDTGFDNKKMAMIYVFFDSSVEKSILDGIDIAAILKSDENFTEKVNAAITSNNRGKNTTVVISIDGVTSTNTYLYTYQIVDNDADTEGAAPITFTNKNRAQFTLDLKKISAESGDYSKAIVLAAINYEGDSLKFSDNCLVYSNGE